MLEWKSSRCMCGVLIALTILSALPNSVLRVPRSVSERYEYIYPYVHSFPPMIEKTASHMIG